MLHMCFARGLRRFDHPTSGLHQSLASPLWGEASPPLSGEFVAFSGEFGADSGEFGAFSRAVDMGHSPVTRYTEGMVMCERALHESAKQPKLSITCLREGGLYCLAGQAYRAISEGAVAAGAAEVGNLSFLARLSCCRLCQDGVGLSDEVEALSYGLALVRGPACAKAS